MQEALTLAHEAYQAGEVPVGAVLVLDGVVIGRGCNLPISQHDPSAHAEILALRDACKALGNYRLPGATLYVTIEPCTMCLGALVHGRVTRVVFGAAEPKAGALISHPVHRDKDVFNHSLDIRHGVCEEQCSALIQRFFRERRLKKKAHKRL